MYSLISGFIQQMFAKPQYQILILGLDDAGKTTYLEQLKHLYQNSTAPNQLIIPPTVGLNIGKIDINNRAKLVFWDLGGQSGLRVLWDKYFNDSHAIIYILDSCDLNRLDESTHEIEKLLQDKDLTDAPLLILLNKSDLKQQSMSKEVIEKALDLNRNNREGRTIEIMSISALLGDNVREGIDWLLNILPKSKRTKALADKI